MSSTRTVFLLAGPSGSGKSRVARKAGVPTLNLDDFYYGADHPGLPHTRGIIDWDDALTWNGPAAAEAIKELARTGRAEVPRYDISTSAAVGTRTVDLGDASCFIAEGIFAIESAAFCRNANVEFVACYLDRPTWLVTLLRFVRDVRERRKPFPVLVRRGLALSRTDSELRRRAMAAGFRPVGPAEALEMVAAPVRSRQQ
ncbi:uridine kinase [Microlunatus sp. Gsoil 973]|nr:uridine kinase [Microlunatus sp. Gsoil 973]